MGADIVIVAERQRPDGGWVPAHRTEDQRPRQLFEFYRWYVITYVLTGYVHYRLDRSGLPAPIVREPRGLPPGLSEEIRNKIFFDSCGAISWLTASEILVWDWHPLLESSPWLAEFVDRVAALDPPADHRVITWLEW